MKGGDHNTNRGRDQPTNLAGRNKTAHHCCTQQVGSSENYSLATLQHTRAPPSLSHRRRHGICGAQSTADGQQKGAMHRGDGDR